MVVELKQVEKKIRGVTVLHDISLRLESGRVYGLRGKNGCGKTMLMRLMCGLIRATSGTVSIDGEVLGRDISFPRSVGALIENPAFINGYTGFQNLKILADIQGKIGEERIREALVQVGLDPDDKRKYRKYSLGMKQRLGIACAFMENPDLVVLDEPINALDEKGVLLVREILDGLRKRGALVVIACHDPEEMAQLADEIYQMEEGVITGHEVVQKNVEPIKMEMQPPSV
jgi:ABC-2 type transport system ATP-binding protein